MTEETGAARQGDETDASESSFVESMLAGDGTTAGILPPATDLALTTERSERSDESQRPSSQELDQQAVVGSVWGESPGSRASLDALPGGVGSSDEHATSAEPRPMSVTPLEDQPQKPEDIFPVLGLRECRFTRESDGRPTPVDEERFKDLRQRLEEEHGPLYVFRGRYATDENGEPLPGSALIAASSDETLPQELDSGEIKGILLAFDDLPDGAVEGLREAVNGSKIVESDGATLILRRRTAESEGNQSPQELSHDDLVGLFRRQLVRMPGSDHRVFISERQGSVGQDIPPVTRNPTSRSDLEVCLETPLSKIPYRDGPTANTYVSPEVFADAVSRYRQGLVGGNEVRGYIIRTTQELPVDFNGDLAPELDAYVRELSAKDPGASIAVVGPVNGELRRFDPIGKPAKPQQSRSGQQPGGWIDSGGFDSSGFLG